MTAAPAAARRRGTTRRAALLGAAGGILSAVLTACGSGAARGPTEPTPRPGGTLGLGIVGLFVRDLGASLDFYRQLGLAIPRDVDLAAGAFRLPLATGQIFFWESYAYARRYFPGYEPAVGDRKVALEFGFASPEEVDAMHDVLVAAGATSTFAPRSWGSIRYAVITDPDDNQIALRFPLAS